jgi:hypothetical protein
VERMPPVPVTKLMSSPPPGFPPSPQADRESAPAHPAVRRVLHARTRHPTGGLRDKTGCGFRSAAQPRSSGGWLRSGGLTEDEVNDLFTNGERDTGRYADDGMSGSLKHLAPGGAVSLSHYRFGGPAMGRPASGVGMTVSPCRTHGNAVAFGAADRLSRCADIPSGAVGAGSADPVVPARAGGPGGR